MKCLPGAGKRMSGGKDKNENERKEIKIDGAVSKAITVTVNGAEHPKLDHVVLNQMQYACSVCTTSPSPFLNQRLFGH